MVTRSAKNECQRHERSQMDESLTAAASRRNPHDLDRIGLEEVDPPPGTRLALGLGAPLAVVLGAQVAVVPVAGVTPTDRRRLVRWLPEADVHTCGERSLISPI
jgi:hypothetical protein